MHQSLPGAPSLFWPPPPHGWGRSPGSHPIPLPLIVLQGVDATGTDSAIKRVMSGLNPQGCVVHPFKVPASEELDQDLLCRASRHLPRRSDIGIFNRSYYGKGRSSRRRVHQESCTVLFVDVCDSTGLYATLGNARAQAAIVKTLEILSRIAIRHRGTVVKTAGDGGLCTFPTAADGAEAAMEMQRSVQRTTTLADIGVESLAIRAGFHRGPVISREGDVFGDAVNVAARMVALAKPGQIIVAKQTAKSLAKSTSIRFVGSIEVKGKSEPFDLFEIVWDHTNLTEMRVVSTAERRNSRLMVVFGTSTIEVDHRRPVIRMGRGPDNEIVVPHAVASRVHARIEYRRGRFILVDQSLNGTYLDIHGGTAIALRRDEIALEGSGLISLGKSGADQHELCVRYSIRSGEES